MCWKAGYNYKGEDVRTPALASCKSMPFIYSQTASLIEFALLIYSTLFFSLTSLALVIQHCYYVFRLFFFFVAPLGHDKLYRTEPSQGSLIATYPRAISGLAMLTAAIEMQPPSRSANIQPRMQPQNQQLCCQQIWLVLHSQIPSLFSIVSV